MAPSIEMGNSNLRLFGIAHMIFGLLLLILSFVQLGITSKDIDSIWNPELHVPPQPGRYSLYAYYPVGAVVFSSLVMLTAGLLGFAAPMSYDYTRKASLISGFKVLSLLSAVVLGPLVLGIGFTYAHLVGLDTAIGKMGAVIAVFGGMEMLSSLIISCMICCHSEAAQTKPHRFNHYREPALDSYGYGAQDRGMGYTKPSRFTPRF